MREYRDRDDSEFFCKCWLKLAVDRESYSIFRMIALSMKLCNDL